ncbi:MAG: hypothetical protein BWY04_01551 [candidate division CPR1 bacterium ADurb.Bin160]|uniref:Uncharacterized protein n=1 Tax=candidate division CPR1 bacterium ADurb.Bin160 TaxID=1852826 RepID=A0A1V5ZHR0_9BACT|nr:MAG: hypothetical protein BWY04_01551 [candidate division CPR1 bacterium ADurb.Bin160]
MNRDYNTQVRNRRVYKNKFSDFISDNYYLDSDEDLFNAEVDFEKDLNTDFWYNVYNRNTNLKHVGFNYEGKILKKSLSGMFWIESKRASILERFEKIVYQMVENVKYIKKFYNYHFDRKWNKFN